MRAVVRIVLGVALFCGVACVRRLPLGGSPCPCAAGFCCDLETNRCVARAAAVLEDGGAGGICAADGGAADARTDSDVDRESTLDVSDADLDTDARDADVRPDADARDAADVEVCAAVARVHTWRTMSTVGAPRLSSHRAVWTGREMLVWGGSERTTPDAVVVGQGARYDPVTDQWTPMSVVGQPPTLDGHAAVWLESTHEMLVWGGSQDPGVGGLYNPDTNTWRTASPVGAPVGRVEPVMVATGLGAIVWCGRFGDQPTSGDGAVYDPVTDRWRTVTTVGAPPCTGNPPFAWTGHELIVFGGKGAVRVGGDLVAGTPTTAGGLYDPMTDRWRPLGGWPPPGRWNASAVFGGGVFIFNGGLISTNEDTIGDGARYDLPTGTWRVLAASAQTGPLFGHSDGAWLGGGALACGGAAAFWGGLHQGSGGAFSADGWLYFPGADRWEPMQALNAPTARADHTVLSTGSTLIVWGGTGATSLTTGAIYTP